MGADRKGPLAAFIVVAIVAAILLVTSVRSQAAPGWFRTPVSTVANVPDVTGDAWSGAADRVHQVVEGGVVLVHRAADDPPSTDPSGDSSDPDPATALSTSVVVDGAADDAVPATVAAPRHRSSRSSVDAGHDWTKATTAARPGARGHAEPAAVVHGHGAAHGHGHAYGLTHGPGHDRATDHAHGHGLGHGKGHAHGNGHGLHRGWMRS